MARHAPLDELINNNNPEAVRSFLDHLKGGERLDFLLATTNDNSDQAETVVHRALDKGCSVEVILCLLESLKPGDLAYILSICDSYGETSFHKIVRKKIYHTPVLINRIFSSLQSLTNLQNLKWVEKRSIGPRDTVLHICCHQGFNSILSAILKTLDKLDGDIWLKLAQQKNNEQLTALDLAILHGHSGAVNILLRSNANSAHQLIKDLTNNFEISVIDASKDKNGTANQSVVCAFIAAVKPEQRFSLVRFNINSNEKKTLLERAIELKWILVLESIDHLLDGPSKDLLVKEKQSKKETVMHRSAVQGDTEIVRRVIGFAKNPEELILQLNGLQQNVLHVAAYNCQPDALSLLLNTIESMKRPLAINMRDKNSRTVFQLAITNEECVKVLLNSIDVSQLEGILVPPHTSQSILHTVAKRGHGRILRCILAILLTKWKLPHVLALLSRKDSHGQTALYIAASNDKYNIFEELNSLITMPVPIVNFIRFKDEQDGESPLHVAARNGHTNTIKAMLAPVSSSYDLYSLLTASSFTGGDSVIHSAVKNGHFDAVKYMLSILSEAHRNQLLTDTDSVNKRTVLHEAFYQSDNRLCELLLESANPNLRSRICQICDVKVKNPLHILRSLTTNEPDKWETVIGLLKDLEPVDIISLLSSTDGNGCIAAQCSPELNNVISFNGLLEALTREAKLQLFSTPDKKGKSVEVLALYHLGQYDKPLSERITLLAHLEEMHPDHQPYANLLKVLTEQISKDTYDQSELCKQDGNGDTILHIAARRNNYKLIKNIITITDEEIRIASLGLKNSYKKTPFQLARSSEEIKGLLSWAHNQKGFYYLPVAPVVLIVYYTKDRSGAEIEIQAFESMMEEFQITPRVEKDLTYDELMQKIREAQEPEISGLILAIMAHGDKGIIWAQDDLVPINDILLTMNSGVLQGKPKILLVQACQSAGSAGQEQSSDPLPPMSAIASASGMPPSNTSTSASGMPPNNAITLSSSMHLERIPTHFDLPGPDFIVLSATINGHLAYRNVFVPELAKFLQESGENEDIHEVFLKTTESMMKTLTVGQTPEYRTTMCKKLCLRNIFKQVSPTSKRTPCTIL